MRLIIAAVGRLKDGPERALFEKYRDRFEPLGKRLGLAPVTWQEIGESRAADPAKRREEEGAALLKLTRDAEFTIVLDERGFPINEMGVLEIPEAAREREALRLLPGKRCVECGNTAVIRKDGCEFCTACGAIGACG